MTKPSMAYRKRKRTLANIEESQMETEVKNTQQTSSLQPTLVEARQEASESLYKDGAGKSDSETEDDDQLVIAAMRRAKKTTSHDKQIVLYEEKKQTKKRARTKKTTVAKEQKAIIQLDQEHAASTKRRRRQTVTAKRKEIVPAHEKEEAGSSRQRTFETQGRTYGLTTVAKKQKAITQLGQEEHAASTKRRRRQTVTAKRKKIVSAHEKEEAGSSRQRTFETQCRTYGLTNVINKLNEDQMRAVDEIGFGGLLTIEITEVQTTMLPWLVQNFNHGSQRLHINDRTAFIITVDDVYDMFCLPRNKGNEVPYKADNDSELRNSWREKYGVQTGNKIEIRLNYLAKRMLELTDGGDEFKRMFVMYAVSSFLAPTSNRVADLRLFTALEDTKKIKEFDWCLFVLQRLCEAVKEYKETKNRKIMGGCILMLEILYFHRLKFRGESQPTELPLIQHWTNEKIKKRINDEASAGFYGDGELEMDVYPLCIHKKESIQTKRTKSKTIDKTEEAWMTSPFAQNTKETWMPAIEKHGNIHTDAPKNYWQFKVPAGVQTDEEINTMARDDIQRACLKLKRNMKIVLATFKNDLSSAKEKDQQESGTQLSPVISQTQQFVSDPHVKDQIDKIIKKMNDLNKAVDNIPSFLSLDDMGFDAVADIAQLNTTEATSLLGEETQQELENIFADDNTDPPIETPQADVEENPSNDLQDPVIGSPTEIPQLTNKEEPRRDRLEEIQDHQDPSTAETQDACLFESGSDTELAQAVDEQNARKDQSEHVKYPEGPPAAQDEHVHLPETHHPPTQPPQATDEEVCFPAEHVEHPKGSCAAQDEQVSLPEAQHPSTVPAQATDKENPTNDKPEQVEHPEGPLAAQDEQVPLPEAQHPSTEPAQATDKQNPSKDKPDHLKHPEGPPVA